MVGIVSLAQKRMCVCVKCKSTLSFVPEEVSDFIERKYIGQAQHKYSLICPHCEHKLISVLPWFPVGLCE